MNKSHEFVTSSNVAQASYSPDTKTLDVWFKKGVPYRYFNFEGIKFDLWTNAQSAGGFFAAEISRKYQCVKLECAGCNDPIDPMTEFDVFLGSAGRMIAYHRRCSKGVNAEMVKL